MGKLQVTICGARNLHDSQVVSLPDPYCRVRLGDKTYKTKVIDNSLNPVWNETFRFQVADENTSQVCVELWNKNVISDDIMGTYVLSVSGMTKGVVQDNWFLLSHSKTNAELHMRLLACDFGNEPQICDRWKITSDINNDPALNAGQKPPAATAPNTVSSNNNNTPIVSNMGPAVVPHAAMQPQMYYPNPSQPMYQQPPMPPQQPMYQQPPMPLQQPMYQQPMMPPQQPMYQQPQQMPPPQPFYPQGSPQPMYQQNQPLGYYPPPQQPYYAPPQSMSPADPNYRY